MSQQTSTTNFKQALAQVAHYERCGQASLAESLYRQIVQEHPQSHVAWL